MEWRPAGWSVCLPQLIFRCAIKSRSSLLAPAHPGGPGKRAVKRLWWWWCGVVKSRLHEQCSFIVLFRVILRATNNFHVVICPPLHQIQTMPMFTRNSSGDEIANITFFTTTSWTTSAPCPLPPVATEFHEMTQNKSHYAVKVIQGYQFRYQSKAHVRLPISDWLLLTYLLSCTVSEM